MTEPAHILVVDDDPAVRTVVAHCLEDAGFRVTALGDGERGAEIVAAQGIRLAVLDIGLPGIDGLTLTRQLRVLTDIGIIILSGRDATTEKIIGLEIGADDYLAKPFEPRELLARVRSVLRRLPRARTTDAGTAAPPPPVYRFARWSLDPARRTVVGDDGEAADLTSGEFDLLEVFVEHPNRVLSRNQLLDYLHGNQTPAFDRSIDVRIRRLRQKIEADPNNPELIKTVRHAGYMFAAVVRKELPR
jgi:two-component system OmpR family response regulator